MLIEVNDELICDLFIKKYHNLIRDLLIKINQKLMLLEGNKSKKSEFQKKEILDSLLENESSELKQLAKLLGVDV